MTTVDQIRARVEAASPGPWRIDEASRLHRATTLVDQHTWIGEVRAPDADENLIAHSRADLEYLLKLLDATQEAMTERATEADYWKKSAIGPVALQVITESSLLAAIVTGLGGETFVDDDVVHFAHHHQRVDVLYDVKREGTTVVVSE